MRALGVGLVLVVLAALLGADLSVGYAWVSVLAARYWG